MTDPMKPAAGRKAPKNRLAAISPARKAAFDILVSVERGHAHSDEMLRGRAVESLSISDRHLATALVLGVLRWQIRLDHQIQSLLQRPNAKLEPEVRIALRVGAFQIALMDRIPARAAIDESVELAKQAGHRFASAMVNAVLRKFATARRSDWPEVSAGELSLAEAHPRWIVERWISSYGFEVARALCRHGQAQPAQILRVADGRADAELVQAGVVTEGGQLLTAAHRVVSGDVLAADAFREGRVRLQDEGSQLVAEIAALAGGQGAAHILDACAAPGGKTFILAERNPQARIVAYEASAARFEQLRQRLAPLAGRVECRLADATTLEEGETFDLVLVDAPCSGTGTLGRNPEIRHRLKVEDLARQADRQGAILSAALSMTRSGGRVVYSTCSLEPEENEQVVAAVLAENQAVRAVSLASSIEALERAGILAPGAAMSLQQTITPEGAIRLLPGRFHCDGFFITMLEKVDPMGTSVAPN